MATVLASLNAGLHRAMEASPDVYVIGEDILDPYGGAFKVTRGLSTKFPKRVITTPISEAGIVGIASGMAIRGLRPVVEIMFGDFLTLAADQLINHAGKFRWMYNDQVSVPLVVRTPMGGRRGYGPTHSQSIEKLFFGAPGLRVVAANAVTDPGTMLEDAVLRDDEPVLFIEHKLLYARQVLSAGVGELAEFHVRRSDSKYPLCTISVIGAPRTDITIACYGDAFSLAREAATRLLYEQEVFAEIVVAAELSPVRLEAVMESVARSQRLVVLEEGGITSGWGAEVLARFVDGSCPVRLRGARRVAARDTPIANSRPLEDAALPQVDDVIDAVLALTSAA